MYKKKVNIWDNISQIFTFFGKNIKRINLENTDNKGIHGKSRKMSKKY